MWAAKNYKVSILQVALGYGSFWRFAKSYVSVRPCSVVELGYSESQFAK